VQLKERIKLDQVAALLNYDVVHIDVPKTIGTSIGIQENPFLKIEMTKSNTFLVTTFGEYIDIKQKGRATQLYKPEVAVGKKKERLQRNPNLPKNLKKTNTLKMKKIIMMKMMMKKKKTSKNKTSRNEETKLI
jgi:hypothetical protein